MPEMKEIISSRRKERNMTQEQLAEKIGVSAKVVSKWETGRSLPDTSFLLPLCDALGLTVQELLRAEEGAKSPLPARPRGNFFTAEIVGAAAFVFAALLFLCGWFIRQGDYWNRKETLCVVLYILAAFFLIGGTAAFSSCAPARRRNRRWRRIKDARGGTSCSCLRGLSSASLRCSSGRWGTFLRGSERISPLSP